MKLTEKEFDTIIEALEQLGVSEETDKTNKELLYYHCSETFRLSPERELWIMTVPKAIKATEMAVAADFLSAIRSVGGVNTIGIAGIAADETIQDAANALQLMVETLREDHLYIDAVILEGLGGKENIASIDHCIEICLFCEGHATKVK